MSDVSDKPRFVTTAELAQAVEQRPTRWEVRFLVLAGFIGAQITAALIPAQDVAQAALSLVT